MTISKTRRSGFAIPTEKTRSVIFTLDILKHLSYKKLPAKAAGRFFGLFLFKHILSYSAEGAAKVFGNVFPYSSGSDIAFRITCGFVINVSADRAYIFFHGKYLPLKCIEVLIVCLKKLKICLRMSTNRAELRSALANVDVSAV